MGGTRPPRFSPEGKRKRGVRIPCCRRLIPFAPGHEFASEVATADFVRQLRAEALGLGATGIGAFYDEEVHRYLSLRPEQGQVVYHFAIGYPVPDTRLEA